MQSICNQLLYEYSAGRKIKKIVMVWTVRDKEILEVFEHSTQNYHETEIPNNLPAVFQPDLLTSEFNTNNWDKFQKIMEFK